MSHRSWFATTCSIHHAPRANALARLPLVDQIMALIVMFFGSGFFGVLLSRMSDLITAIDAAGVPYLTPKSPASFLDAALKLSRVILSCAQAIARICDLTRSMST